MRIALLCSDRGAPLGGRKGCSVHLRAMADAWLRAGHDVSALVAEPGPLEGYAALVERGLEVRPLRHPVAVREVDWHLARIRPDLVYERLSLMSPEGARAAAEAGVPHVYEVNAPLDHEASRHRQFDQIDEARAAFKAGFADSAGSVCVSAAVADWVREVAPETHVVQVEPNGASRSFLESPNPESVRALANRFKLEPGEFRVGFVGNVRPWHDLGTMVAAASILHRERAARLIMVGDGRAHNDVLRGAAAARLGVTLCGTVDHDAVPLYLALCDAVVVPYSSTKDYFSPLKLLEAMAAGRAVVASATEPVMQLVRDGHDALLVPPGDTDAMAAALLGLARDPIMRARLGTAARRRVAKYHTWDMVARRVLEFAGSLARTRADSCGS